MNGFKEFKLPNDPIFADFSVSICEYGAKENNMQKNIEALKTAINICSPLFCSRKNLTIA